MTRIPAQHIRRLDVLLLFTLYPAGMLLLYSAMSTRSWNGLAHIVFTVATATLFGIQRIGRVDRAIADDIDTRLDARQRTLRNSAYL